MSGPFLFRCPRTEQYVQGWLDDKEDAGENDYQPITCLACAGLHFINFRSGKLLGHEDRLADDQAITVVLDLVDRFRARHAAAATEVNFLHVMLSAYLGIARPRR